MDTIGGKPDPIYLKQGIYRSSAWTTDHVLYFAPVTVSDRHCGVLFAPFDCLIVGR